MPQDATAIPASTPPVATEAPAPVVATATPVPVQGAATATPVPSGNAPERSLADHVADHLAMVQQKAKSIGAKASKGAPQEPTTPVPSVAEPVATPTEPAAPTQPPELAAPVEPPKVEPPKPPEDERAKALAEFVRGQQRNRTEAKRLHAESERIKSEDARLTATRGQQEQFAETMRQFETDPVAAVEKLLGKEKFSSEFLLKALDRASKMEGGEQVTEEQRQDIIAKAAAAKVREEIKAEQEAEAARVSEEAKVRNEEGQSRYFVQVESVLRANEARFPNMAAEGWDTREMIAAVESHHVATGQWPTAEQVLGHFETKHVARAQSYAKRLGMAPAAPTSPAALSPSAAPVRAPTDMRGKASKPMPQGTLDQRKAEIIARLDGMKVG